MKDLCRKHGFSNASFYKLRAKYGRIKVSKAKRLNELESENGKLRSCSLRSIWTFKCQEACSVQSVNRLSTSCLRGAASKPKRRRRRRCSPISKSGTSCDGGTRASNACRRRNEAKNANRFEQRVTHSPASVSLRGQHERGPADNPAPIEAEVSDINIGTSSALEFLQP